MLNFGKKDIHGRRVSDCGEYFVYQESAAQEGKDWRGCKLHADGGFTILVRSVDFDEARWVCEDDKFRYPCGCVLTIRPNWWKHCPKCGAKLPEPKPYVPPPPKPERKKKVLNRPDWLYRRSLGTEHGENWDCVYDGKMWALVRVPGYKGWVSVGRSEYGPTTYEVMRRQSDRGQGAVQAAETTGLTSLLSVPRFAEEPGDFSSLTVHEGRATKADLARFRAMVDELDARGL